MSHIPERYFIAVDPDGSTRRIADPGTASARVDLINEIVGGTLDMTRLLHEPPLVAMVHDEGLLINLPMQRRKGLHHLAGVVILGTEAFDSEYPEDGPDFVGFERPEIIEQMLAALPLVTRAEAQAAKAKALGISGTVTPMPKGWTQ